MKIYSYRPPRIRPAGIDPVPRRRNYSLFLIPFLVVFGIVFGLHFLPAPEMISALISDGVNDTSSPVQKVDEHESSLLAKVTPFLKGNTERWTLHNVSVQPAIGGGPGILKDALDLKAGISVNFDNGDVYYAHNATERLKFASITKIMTTMTAMDLVSLDEKFTVQDPATEVEPTIIGVKAGEQLTARELIKAGLLTSGNDAMAVLAQGIGEKYGADSSLFVAAMNQKAKAIGLNNTHFTNPQGYDDPEHYSTAEDIIYMTRYALKNYPEISHIVTKKEEFLKATATHKSFNLPNWNMLIGTYPGADGVKIGNTGDAGHTTVASATRNGTRVLVVVLGADGILKRDLSAAELLNVGFAQNGIAPFPMTEDLLRTRINEWYK